MRGARPYRAVQLRAAVPRGAQRCSLAPERADEAVKLSGLARRAEDARELSGVTEAYVVKYGEGFPDPAVNPLFAVLPDSVIGLVEDDFSNRAILGASHRQDRWRTDAL